MPIGIQRSLANTGIAGSDILEIPRSGKFGGSQKRSEKLSARAYISIPLVQTALAGCLFRDSQAPLGISES